ncbi:Carbohydrate binding module (family 35) [Nonomuraea solani]|uniref:Carbohydrate binding module (Family 35) n=1 Tax=Nonomuraea solani TaxID=1144553 RepID=A0A1H5WGB8_9ACTN|nr:family 16 glycoside hydrolase [Nonomuraea solani]SEF98403.1 Carbohydrate binding module (family 35) [Nonomuraea solani]
MRKSPLLSVLLITALSSLVAPAPAHAAVPPQQPGVTLRTYDVQVELNKICTLKAGQTPNVDKLMPTIDWTSDADFGLTDMFVTEVIGNLNVPSAGTYEFRLTSDDGSRLRIDDTVVITNEGRHAPIAIDGMITLTPGYHALRVDHFEHLYGQQLKLEWKPPGAAGFTLVPTSVLSTDAGVVRVTAPGRKECESGADSPGDGLPLRAVHPDFALTDLRPAGFEPQVSAMDWLPDGRLAIATWGGSGKTLGEVYLLGNVGGRVSADRVTTKKIASGLQEPMGIKYVDGKLYVSEKSRLVELNDTNGDEVADSLRTVATWPFGGNFHEFAFGLLYRDGHFYLNLSVAINEGGATTDPQPARNRGTTIKVSKATGQVEYLAGGLRTPNGIGWGPEDELFVADNQGGWLPASKLVHVKKDRFFNHYMNPDGPFDNNVVSQPALWLPHNEIANSPSTPLLMKQGRFAGQMLFGDVTYGGIQRAYLEKVNGEYQGAVFRLTQGLEAGVNRISLGPDGAIYAGGLGAGGNWGQPGKLTYGLQKLTPSGDKAFDILKMRAIEGGFELEYTEPLSAETSASLAAKYQATQWRYVAASTYGGPKVDEEPLTITSAEPSARGKIVTLKIAGLKPGRVVHLRSPRPFSSASGQQLWSTEAWYTLNSLVGGPVTDTTYEAESASHSGGAKLNTDHRSYTGSGFVDNYQAVGANTQFAVRAATAGTYHVGLRYSNGPNPAPGQLKSLSVYVNGAKVRQVPLAPTDTWDQWATRVEPLVLKAGANTIAYRYDTGDTGHVNLDSLTVAARPVIEAESAALSGGAQPNTDHQGYTGTGFVDGYWNAGANTSFTVQADSAGPHNVGLRYASDVGTSVSVYVNGTKVRQSRLAATSGWDDWAVQTEALDLRQGANTVAYRYDTGDGGRFNLDHITVSKAERIKLFDGSSLAAWEKRSGGAATWPIADGAMESYGGDIRTRRTFGDFKLHVEWNEPDYPPDVTGQQRGNSGVFLQERYEVQVLESFGDTTLANNEAGAIYSKRAPDRNMATASGTWQTYDITYRAPRFTGAGVKVDNARVTVIWNGVVVHDNVAIDGGTGDNVAESAASGAIRLQDHGDAGANPRFRNVWIEPVS